VKLSDGANQIISSNQQTNNHGPFSDAPPDIIGMISARLSVYDLVRFLSCCSYYNQDEIWRIAVTERPKKSIINLNNSNINHKQLFSDLRYKEIFVAHYYSRSYMLQINGTRAGAMPQLSKVVFRDIQDHIIVPNKVHCRYPEPNMDEGAANLVSTTNRFSKWYAGQNNPELENLSPFPFEKHNICVVFEFTAKVHLVQYKFITANDSIERDPVHWSWYIGLESPKSSRTSNHRPKAPISDIWATNWAQISKMEGANAPSLRYANYAPYQIFA